MATRSAIEPVGRASGTSSKRRPVLAERKPSWSSLLPPCPPSLCREATQPAVTQTRSPRRPTISCLQRYEPARQYCRYIGYYVKSADNLAYFCRSSAVLVQLSFRQLPARRQRTTGLVRRDAPSPTTPVGRLACRLTTRGADFDARFAIQRTDSCAGRLSMRLVSSAGFGC